MFRYELPHKFGYFNYMLNYRVRRLKMSKRKFGRTRLVDETFDISGNINELLEAEIFYEIMISLQIYTLDTKLILLKSIFG